MRGLARGALRRFGFQRALKAIALRLKNLEMIAAPQLIDLPPGTRLLVLAPHPDDESIGCGGTLAKWRHAGLPAKVLFITDGRLGSRALRQLPESDPARGEAQRSLIDTRKSEAHAALHELGVEEFAFADVPDGELWNHVDQVARIIVETIEDYRPDVIMLPFLTDRHPDHVAAGVCLLAALRQLGPHLLGRLTCAGYEVWSPIQANSVVDISAWVDKKTSAICAHASQLRDTNYLEGALSLNRLRAVSNVISGSHAQAFYVAPAEVYRSLVE